MGKITTKQFQVLSDVDMAWDFMVEAYEGVGDKGTESVEAPFFEYALTSMWMDKSYLHLCRFWLEEDVVVGFVFYENPVTNIHFVLRPGYEWLADEMIVYADEAFPEYLGEKEFVFSECQTELMEAAEKRGYKLSDKEREYRLDMTKASLAYELPEGFRFVEPEEIDALKLSRCMWKGFNEWELGPFENWTVPDESSDWSTYKSYLGVWGNVMAPPPHSTYEYSVAIADEKGEYACFAGMWWVEENKLAYLEPLCTIPEYRHRGLAAAALTRHYRTFKELGGKFLTGGGNEFYKKIGYDTEVYSLIYKK